MTKILIRSFAAIGILAGIVFISVGLAGRTDPINSRLDLAISQSPGQNDQLTGTLEIVLDDKALASFAAIGEYQPAAAMTDIIDHLDLADGGWWLINENQPELISRVEMAKLCGPKAFGCFVGYKDTAGQPVGSSIAIVRDLPHKQAVEALAHELLHGAYHHLDGFNLDQVNGWLDNVYSDNQASLDHRLEPYGQQTTASRYHELHSFVGTIVDDLPADFEAHYRQHFNNRAAIVSHAPASDHSGGNPSPATDNPAPQPSPASEPELQPKPTSPAERPDISISDPEAPEIVARHLSDLPTGLTTASFVCYLSSLEIKGSLHSYDCRYVVDADAPLNINLSFMLYHDLDGQHRAGDYKETHCRRGLSLAEYASENNLSPYKQLMSDHIALKLGVITSIEDYHHSLALLPSIQEHINQIITDPAKRLELVEPADWCSPLSTTETPPAQTPQPTPSPQSTCILPEGWDNFTLAQKYATNPCGCDLDRYPQLDVA